MPFCSHKMTFNTIMFNNLKQLLLLHKGGMSNRAIAKELHLNKDTVGNYVSKAKMDNLGIDGLLLLDEPELNFRLKGGGNTAYTDSRFEDFKKRLPYLMSEMQRPHVTLKLLWEEYRSEFSDGYSLTQFRFHYSQHVSATKTGSKTSTVLKDTYVGGEKMYVDFAGDTQSYVDKETGELITVQVFVATLPASDYGFVTCTRSQKTEDFIDAIVRAFEFFGGIPKILTPDNLKSAVIKADKYEPEINKVLADLGAHYGFVVIPTRAARPKDKCYAESLVKISYRRIYAELRNQVFYSFEELDSAILEKCIAHNKRRIENDFCTREERFLAIDKPNLQPIKSNRFEIKCYTDLKVQSNCCIFLGKDKHYYSVPYQFIGQVVNVVFTITMVNIYAEGKLVARHKRDRKPGQYTIVKEHLASASQAYRDRSPQYYIEKARYDSDELEELFVNMFHTSKYPPEFHYKTCEGLLHLHMVSDPIIFKRACKIALEKNIYSYAFISKIVKTNALGLDNYEASEQNKEEKMSDHENLRGNEYE